MRSRVADSRFWALLLGPVFLFMCLLWPCIGDLMGPWRTRVPSHNGTSIDPLIVRGMVSTGRVVRSLTTPTVIVCLPIAYGGAPRRSGLPLQSLLYRVLLVRMFVRKHRCSVLHLYLYRVRRGLLIRPLTQSRRPWGQLSYHFDQGNRQSPRHLWRFLMWWKFRSLLAPSYPTWWIPGNAWPCIARSPCGFLNLAGGCLRESCGSA